MKKLDISDLHLTDWTEYKGDRQLAGGSAQTKEAIERIVEKINELIESNEN